MEVARAAEQAALERGYNLIVCNTDESLEREQAYLSILNEQLVAGIILAPAPGERPPQARRTQNDVPMVMVNRRLDGLQCTSITADDEEATFQCVSHLIGEGRRRIAAITGLPGISTTETRLKGYQRALAEHGLALDPGLEVAGHATLEGGYQATMHLMQGADAPDALFVFNNVMTQGAVMALQDLGLRWPNEVDIAGFGAYATARLYRPPLTLIAQPTFEMGQQAVELLLARVEGRTDGQPKMVQLRNRVILRDEWRRP